MHARTRRSHAPKPKLGAICTVSWRGREPSRTPKTSPHRRLRRTPNASTRTFGHSSARSNRRDAAREASCTLMATAMPAPAAKNSRHIPLGFFMSSPSSTTLAHASPPRHSGRRLTKPGSFTSRGGCRCDGVSHLGSNEADAAESACPKGENADLGSLC